MLNAHTKNIINKARELGALLVDSNEYQEMKSSEINMYNDVQTVEKIQQYRQKELHYYELQSSNKVDAKVLIKAQKDMMEAGRVMDECPLVIEYLRAKKEFDSLNILISQILTHYTGQGVIGGCSGRNCGGCHQSTAAVNLP